MHRSAKLGLYGLVLAGLVGGTVAWASADKTVTVSVDGQSRTIHTTAKTVGAALHDERISVGGHDALAPSADSSLQDKGRIVLLRGRLLHLSVDGKRKDVWTTAGTVDEALAQLGYGRGQLVGVSRSKRLPLSPTALEVVTPKRVVITADRRNRTVMTTESTVGDLLQSMNLKLGRYDQTNAKLTATVVRNQHIIVKRVVHSTKQRDVPLPYRTKDTKDPNSYEGSTEVVTAGKTGVQRQTVLYIYVDGKLYSQRVVGKQTVSNPTDEQRKVGTKSRPAAPPSSGSGSDSGSSGGSGDPTPIGDAQAIAQKMVTAHGWGSGEFGCLVNLWNRESGWNTHAANPSGAYGIPQALPGSKMSTAGPDWQNNATTQITWGINYIAGVYGSPCNAWAHSNNTGWY